MQMETIQPTQPIDQWFPTINETPAQVNHVQTCSIRKRRSPPKGIFISQHGSQYLISLQIIFEINKRIEKYR